MINLDDLDRIKQLDRSNVLGSIDALPDQCQQAWEDASQVEIPESYKEVKNLVMTGMGGSGLAARLIESLFWQELLVPLTQVHDYDLPGFVNEDTLVICSSYSGTTEETLENAKQAIAKKAKWLAVATGDKLIELAKENQAPYYQINPVNNPSNQPRMAIGYSVLGQLALVNKLGLIRLTETDLEAALTAMADVKRENGVDIAEINNPAKRMAQKLWQKSIVFIGAQHLMGALHTVKNQLNENAKTFGAAFDIPELNHHLIEGLKHPESNKKDLLVFMIESSLYSERIKKRVIVTKDVIEQNQIECVSWQPQSQKKLAQALELIQFGAFVNFYLAMLYGIDPAPIPWVDYFKEQLAR